MKVHRHRLINVGNGITLHVRQDHVPYCNIFLGYKSEGHIPMSHKKEKITCKHCLKTFNNKK